MQNGFINLDFLRSGMQFLQPAKEVKEPLPVPSPKTSKRLRLETFHAITLESSDQKPPTSISLDAIRSGRGSVLSHQEVSTVVAPRTPKMKRLDNFYNKTLKTAQAKPVAINMDLLRSGSHLNPPTSKAAGAAIQASGAPKNTRLEEFHNKTLISSSG
jgi:hypothetical protein